MVVIHLISTTQFRMKMSLPVKETSEIDSDGIQVNDQGVVVPTGVVAIANSFMEKEDSWFISPRLPTDLTIQVEDANFTVHKYPLMSKCGYIGNMELQPSISSSGYKLKLENFPGGPEAFETVLKFCYGLPLDLNPKNIAPLRCASQYLEMSEELEDRNLISKTEAFLSFIILSSWKDAITVLESCENLSPWAENLQIVRRCCDSIAWKVSRDNSIGVVHNEGQWWFDDVANLRIDYFTRIVNAIRAKGVKPEITGKCIMCYAARWLPGIDMELENLHGYGYGKNELQFGIQNRREEDQGAAAGYNNEQKAIIESLVSILPPQQEAVPCKFLLKMLNMAMVYSASPALISELEKRVGMTLDNASVNDLLIPNYKIDNQGTNLVKQIEQQTVYNIDVVQRIFDYFLMHEQEQQHENQPMTRKSVVSRLLDNYLAEIARDPHLSITKFQVLADSLPENSRQCHDGLYRAIDTYLKIHPVLSEHDRKRLCKTMNCEKLSLDARMHAAQNERLPLRTVIQVLFAEQVKMRATMGSNEHVASGSTSEQENNQTATKTEIMTLKTELENVKSKMAELQKDYSDLQQEYEKITKPRRNTTTRSFGWRMIRQSALFSRKVDGSDENGEGERRRNSLGRKLNFRRRRSIS